MKQTTRIIAKPHVAQFIRAKYPDAIPHRSLLMPLIECCLTAEASDRFKQTDKYETLEIQLPNRFTHLFLAEDMANRLALMLDTWFWQEVKLYIYQQLTDPNMVLFKEDAISLFYGQFGFTEELYARDHFRRMLQRMDIKGAIPADKKIEKRYSTKLSNQQSMQVYRLMKQKKLSARTIKKYFPISHQTATNIFNKISRQLS